MAEYTPPSGPNAPNPEPQPSSQQAPPQHAPGAIPPYGAPPRDRPFVESVPRDVPGKKVAAGVLGILLGWLGIHKFVLGYTGAGLVMLLGSIFGGILTLGLASTVFWVIGIVEGILYLTKTDDDFYRTYVVGRKTWF